MNDGDSEYPTKHISIRVPWHDLGWEGVVCQFPHLNSSCLILDRLAPKKDDGPDFCYNYDITKQPKYRNLREEKNAGISIEDLDDLRRPSCIGERMAFLSPFEYHVTIKYPYTYKEKLNHFLPTTIRNPPYSAFTVPFFWLSKKGSRLFKELDILPISFEQEKKFEKDNEIKTDWMNTLENQKLIMDWFYRQIKPEKSLCFFYAKKVPFVEDQSRIIIGAGRVTKIDPYREYDYKEEREYGGIIWERTVHHSIRPDFEDGFILPYHQAIKYAEEHPEKEIDPSEFAVFPPKGKIGEFSYVTEHVSNDSAIDVLLSCAESLNKAKDYKINGPWEKGLRWINTQLDELWRMRGPYPGMGSALTALGVSLGNFIAWEIGNQRTDDEDPWFILETAFGNPQKYFSPNLIGLVKELHEIWNSLKKDEKDLLKLLSRFDLSSEQAEIIFLGEEKEKNGLFFKNIDVLKNPYLIFEQTRHTIDPVSFLTIDHGVLPGHEIASKFPLPEDSKIESELDWRRIRALIVEILEDATYEGHSLLSIDLIINIANELQLEPPCKLNEKILRAKEKHFSEVIEKVEMKNDKQAYQLKEVAEMGAFIKSKILARKRGKRNLSDTDWENLLYSRIENEHGIFDEEDEDEKKAREEKASALREIAESRVSVLIGSAGTGKTTLLSILANHDEINNKGILLLAPTGKARVKMEQALGLSSRKDPKVHAFNIAQFLIKSKRYDPDTGRFLLNNEPPKKVGETVIIDEASMLTEEMLGSLLQSIKGYKRLIFVGDRHQLPPIGTGRPFVDIITEFKPEDIDNEDTFPKVGPSYAELTINRRQRFGKCGKRVDIQLANWFRGGPVKSSDDEIYDILAGIEKSDCLQIYQWKDEEEFRKLILKILQKELNLINTRDFKTFNNSLGAFNGSFKVGSALKAEDWQILSPVRNRTHGVSEINRLIHQKFKGAYVRSSKSRKNKGKRAQPAGTEEIVWGDKVINIQNQSLGAWNAIDAEKEDGYLANGEIGLLVQTPKINNKFFALKFEFTSQPGLTYSFFNSLTPMDRKYKFRKIDEEQPSIELAYALTVHKAQGSEFGKVILVIPKNSFNLSRELIYTALTRQKEGIVILYEGDPVDLMNYSDEKWSETHQRLTNLFEAPYPHPIKNKNDRFLEDRLIHRTLKGDDVRSKSEVIIANILYHHGIEYEYEGVLEFGRERRRPDFVIEDDDSGETYYWEHLGMLNKRSYRQGWERKKQWYHDHGITEEGGDNGTLIISVDNRKGGISSQDIENTLKQYSLID